MKVSIRNMFFAGAVFALAITAVFTGPAKAEAVVYKHQKEICYSLDENTGKWIKRYVTEIKYNKNGDPKTITMKNMDEDGKLSYTIKYKSTYDKNGNIKTDKEYHDGDLHRTTKYGYYKNGDLKTVAIYSNGEKKYTEKKVFSYNKGKISKIKKYGSDQKLQYTEYYTYNGKKSETSIQKYPNGNQYKLVTKYTYKNGYLVKQVAKNSSGVVWTYNYNKKGLITKESAVTPDYTSTLTYSYKYYKKKYVKQMITEEKFSSGDSYKTKFVYSNWTKF